jgi:hypothetical protein
MSAKLSSPAGSTSALTGRVQAVVRAASSGSARNMQRAIGPSQIGNECDRSLAYQVMDMQAPRSGIDPWASIVGTAVHAWLAQAFTNENIRSGELRYLVETPVKLTDGIRGTADLFDLWEAEVIDHKILGVDSHRHIKNGAIPTKYRVQLHLYGRGFQLAGMPVSKVSIVAYPRSGFLDGIVTWSEPYNQALAEAAMDRLSRISAAALVLELDTNPDRWALIPHSPGPECTWCPFWRPGLLVDGGGCPGPEMKEAKK